MANNFINDTWEQFNRQLKGKKLVLFGFCDMGLQLMEECKKYSSSWEILCFIDNDSEKWKEAEKEEISVRPPDYLKTLNLNEVIVLITSMHITEMSEQLEKLHVKYYYSSFWLDQSNRDFYVQTDMDVSSLARIKDFLVDQRSRDILDKVIYKRKNGLLDYSDIYSSTEYFIDDIFTHGENEVFVDGGGYTGDTIEDFDMWTKGKYKRIYSYEPDISKARQLKQKLYRYGDKVRFFEMGLYSREAELIFEENNDFYSSRVTSDESKGSYRINCCTIDQTVAAEDCVSFLKLDIEGVELEALEGAKNTIVRHKPKLAICIYHKLNDLWEIPIWIHELVPEYKFYIRHHGRRCYGTILYATL